MFRAWQANGFLYVRVSGFGITGRFGAFLQLTLASVRAWRHKVPALRGFMFRMPRCIESHASDDDDDEEEEIASEEVEDRVAGNQAIMTS